MATVFDVAAYILQQRGRMSAMKLQKLVYYCQAWSLVWDARPLFENRIEAWANGPVSPELYRRHAGSFEVENIGAANPERLDAIALETINSVLQTYGNKAPHWLSLLTHSEDPWISARGETPPGAWCDNEITQAAMAEYYDAL